MSNLACLVQLRIKNVSALAWMLVLLAALGECSTAMAADAPARPTPLTAAQLDATAFSQWHGGVTTPITAEQAKGGPRDILWTQDSNIEWRGIEFGAERTPGVRRLRIGFRDAIPVGSVLVRGGGRLSVLKADAPYPGDLGAEGDWIPAARLGGDAAAGREDYAIWTLPPGTKTRALCFTHVAEATDPNPAGWLGGAWVLAERMTNVAPQATVTTSARSEAAGMLIDESNNRLWPAWDNGEQGGPVVISPEQPVIVTLSWPRAVELSSACLLWTGAREAEVEVFTGADDVAWQTAPASAWKRVATARGLDPLYPRGLVPAWLHFDQTYRTKAMRLRITQAIQPGHPHLMGKVKEGKRIWLGELLALAPLGDRPLDSARLPTATETPPPIAIKFTLPEAGLVTLVIEDEQGQRIRNLLSETPFPAGENTAYWDGSDDLLRDVDAAKHGLYHIPTRFVAPGKYVVRGLWRKPVTLAYQMSVYSAGQPAWETADKTGCWMTNHTPPTSIACVPGSRTKDGQPLVFMGAFVAEGGHGLQWIREDGTKVGGQGWLGGTWTGAPTLCVDRGTRANAQHLCYAGSVWEGELRLTAKTTDFGDQPVLKLKLGDDPPEKKLAKGQTPPVRLEGFDGGERIFVLAGIAAHDGVLVCSLVRQNELLFVDGKRGEVTGKRMLENPRGLCFDAQGQLYVLSGTKLVRLSLPEGRPETVIERGLEDPRHVAIDADGRFYISDRGAAHQVKVFSPTGEFVRAIGKAGAPAAGAYDRLHMNQPNGLGIDSQRRVWVAEDDFHPKRVSLWSPSGDLLRTFYGPGEYGGGGVLDSADTSRFFYKGLEFKLDGKTGDSELVRVFFRPGPLFEAHYGPYSPDMPLYPAASKGERYFTSCYTHNPTSGDHVTFLWKDDGTLARLVAAVGNPHEWHVLQEERFHAVWPAGVDPRGDRHRHPAAFAWSDRNGDGLPQPAEVQMVKATCYGITTAGDLSCIVARFNESAVRFAPIDFNEHGAPRYDLTAPVVLTAGAQSPRSSGGDQALVAENGWTIHTVAPLPFSPYSLGGSLRGAARWSYPNPWPGLHASHEAAVPDRPGMVIGTTRLLGGMFTPKGEAGPMFGINGNMGNMYLFTADGLFVATLFHDIRLRPKWAMPTAVRGMDVSNVSLHDENFWPSLTQSQTGEVFVVDGGRVSVVQVQGLETIRRLEQQPFAVTRDDLARAQAWFAAAEAERQAAAGSGAVRVAVRAAPPKVDGQLDDWPATTDWASIDRRGTKANFNSDSKPYDASAAVTISGDRLYAAWRTTEKDLLKNSGETPSALFKTGGCLDLMLGTDPAAKADRAAPVAGDIRLLVALVNGKPVARLYRAKVAGTREPVAFSSPWRTITLDVVEDISDQLAFAASGTGQYEISLPLAVLGWKPKPGEAYRGDLGVLRGDGSHTTQRVYWSNKATAITSDVPSEAELTPKLWGRFEVVEE